MKPTKPSDYIGKTQIIAKALFNKIPALQSKTLTDPVDRCFLFTGPAGVGKSSLAEAFGQALAGNKLAVEQVNGQSCSVELVRRWQEEGWYMPLYGKLWVKIIDEIDAASPAACNQARTWLDTLSPHTVVLATTNKTLSDLQEQLQSRFKVSYFEPVAPDLIANWLVEHYRLTLEVAARIASGVKGNVRAAKSDALNVLDFAATP